LAILVNQLGITTVAFIQSGNGDHYPIGEDKS
jgi:hypothetical protein